MARGGIRAGAGRPKGSRNKLTIASRELAASSGALPHEVLLSVCRGEVMLRDVMKIGDQMVEIERLPTIDERIKAATAAAPYYAPRLAAQVVVGASEGNPLEELMKAVERSATNRARPIG